MKCLTTVKGHLSEQTKNYRSEFLKRSKLKICNKIKIVLESTMFCFDNSDYQRNGDCFVKLKSTLEKI